MLDVMTLLGALVVAIAGLIMGSSAWPYKLMRRYKFEHWWFISGIVGLVALPWAIALFGCRHPWQSLSSLPFSAILIGNLFAVGWGIANVLCGLCFYRIGVALTGAVLAGLGSSVGAIAPMVFKGSGLFKDAPGVTSPAGIAVLVGVAVLLVGVAFASLAGFGRDRVLKHLEQHSGNFVVGLTMAAIAGVLSSFISFVFVYSQAPIVANFSDVYPGQELRITLGDDSQRYTVGGDGTVQIDGVGKIQVGDATAAVAADRIVGALRDKNSADPPEVRVETGSISATFAVYAIGLMAGALLNIGYAAHLLTKNKSWRVLKESVVEFVLAILIGINFSVAATLMGKGMLLLGALGASVGFGIQQAMQMTGGQLLGFISGEWRGVYGKPRVRMYLAIAVLIGASVILAYSNTLAKG